MAPEVLSSSVALYSVRTSPWIIGCVMTVSVPSIDVGVAVKLPDTSTPASPHAAPTPEALLSANWIDPLEGQHTGADSGARFKLFVSEEEPLFRRR